MVIEIKLNDGPKILAKSPKPQILVFLIKDPKKIIPKHFASNNPLERHTIHTSTSNIRWATNAHVTYITCLSQLISTTTIKCDLYTIIN
jgi:hypothetical protein